MKKTLLLLVSICWALALCAQTNLTLSPTQLTVPGDGMDQFLDYQLVRMDINPLYRLWEAPDDLIAFTLENEGAAPLAFELYRYDLRRPDYVLTSGSRDNDDLVTHPRLPAAQFKGILNGSAANTSIFTITEDFVLGYWETPTTTTYLEPLWRFWPEAPRDVYVLYNEEQIEPDFGTCPAVAELYRQHDDRVQVPVESESAIGECIEVELALASDFELFQDFLSVGATENFMLNILALVETNYDSQIGDEEFEDELNFFVTNTVIASSEASDPWTNDTDATVLLPDFRSWGNTAGNFPNGYDVATLWTGRDFDGMTVGLAYIGVICGSFRYNTVENHSASNALLRVTWSHELGHNFNAEHNPEPYGGNIMDPFVNNSDTWTVTSRNTINAHYQSRTCLDNCPQSVPMVGFTVSDNPACPGTEITFTNTTTGTVSSFQWSFPGGIPSTSTEVNPTVLYNNQGSYTATLTASNSAGSDSEQLQIQIAAGNPQQLFFEDFEDGNFGNITVDNPDGDVTWALRNTAGNSGTLAAAMNNYNSPDPSGTRDELDLPVFDMSASSGMRLQFEYAYAQFNANFSDRLEVKVTTPSGINVVYVGDESMAPFVTAPDDGDPFTPTSANDWCFNGPGCVDLDLSAFDGNNSVEISIVNVSGFGNFMYVDNISVSANCSPPTTVPVEWLSFEARARNRVAELNWSVIQDEAHAGFHVQRAAADSPGRWVDLGFVARRANAASSVAYAFTDRDVRPNGRYLYRLRQVDTDGTEDFSVIRAVDFGAITSAGRIEAWPNPNRGGFTLSVDEAEGDYQLYDLTGRQLLRGPISGTTTEVQLGELPSGVYWLRVNLNSGATETLRIVRE